MVGSSKSFLFFFFLLITFVSRCFASGEPNSFVFLNKLLLQSFEFHCEIPKTLHTTLDLEEETGRKKTKTKKTTEAAVSDRVKQKSKTARCNLWVEITQQVLDWGGKGRKAHL